MRSSKHEPDLDQNPHSRLHLRGGRTCRRELVSRVCRGAGEGPSDQPPANPDRAWTDARRNDEHFATCGIYHPAMASAVIEALRAEVRRDLDAGTVDDPDRAADANPRN